MNIPKELMDREPFIWRNPDRKRRLLLDKTEMEKARENWKMFSPLLRELFGVDVIDSPLRELRQLHAQLPAERYLLKEDNSLPVAGSIKARGGFYEVLSHAWELARDEGVLREGDVLDRLASQREFFSKHALYVASTGNLGLSIGFMGRSLGFPVYVYMSEDAKEWKKELLRGCGAQIVEVAGDYSLAVERGREAAMRDPKGYFVDDERSLHLFWGYSKAGYDLIAQLPEDLLREKPLFVSIPCGVGGAPGGIAYALKALLGDRVHIFFAEPLDSPALLLGMATGKGEEIRVQDIGLSGKTVADGLAVGKPSGFVCEQMKEIIGGIYTVKDEALLAMQYLLHEKEGVQCEPSACAGLLLPYYLRSEAGRRYLEDEGIEESQINYVFWSTGGERVPQELFMAQLEEGRKILKERSDVLCVK